MVVTYFGSDKSDIFIIFTYKNGRREGKEYNWHQDEVKGIWMIKEWKDNQKVGSSEEYHPNGMLRIVNNWENNSPEGPSWVFDDDGNLLQMRTFRRGNLHGVTKTYQRGSLYEESTYENGRKKGPYRFYDEDGNIVKEGTR